MCKLEVSETESDNNSACLLVLWVPSTPTEVPPDLQLVDCGVSDMFAQLRLRGSHGQG